MFEAFRGSVAQWECDMMGHMNVRHYFAKCDQAIRFTALRLGITPSMSREEGIELVITDQHVRFLQEQHAGSGLGIRMGVLDFSDSQIRLYQEIYNTLSGDIATTFITTAEPHRVADDSLVAWPEMAQAFAEANQTEIPGYAQPRSLDLVPGTGNMTMHKVEELGLYESSAGVITATHCDGAGRIRPAFLIGHIADGVVNMTQRFKTRGFIDDPDRRIGGAVLEYRLIYRSRPRAGSLFTVRTGLAEVMEKTNRFATWMMDLETGKPILSAASVGLSFDLDTRKVVAPPPEARAEMAAMMTPGLFI